MFNQKNGPAGAALHSCKQSPRRLVSGPLLPPRTALARHGPRAGPQIQIRPARRYRPVTSVIRVLKVKVGSTRITHPPPLVEEWQSLTFLARQAW